MLFRKKRAIVLDTNILLYWAGKFKGFLKYLKKIKGEVFIPWAVQVELSTMAYKSKTKDEKWRTATPKEKEELKRQAKKRILSKKELNLRERNQLAVRAYPFAQEQAEKGNWKLVGRDEEIEFYRKGIAEIEKKFKDQIQKY